MAKTFISFLGTSEYLECIYYSDNRNAEIQFDTPEKFVQASLLRMLSHEFSSEDKGYILVTEASKKRNWEKLNNRLEELRFDSHLKIPVEPRIIPDGNSMDEIWQLVSALKSCINPEDEVYMDITHSFRFLPMLSLATLTYLEHLNNVKVKAVYYGAFEKILNDLLIPADEKSPVQYLKDNVPVNHRRAPILNLVGLLDLQNWATAVYDFVQLGNARKIEKLTEDSGFERKYLSEKLNQLTTLLATNRGLEVETGKVLHDCIDAVLKVRNADSSSRKWIDLLLDRITAKLNTLNTGEPRWLSAARWCYEHGWVQQGLTQLQEGIITYIIQQKATSGASIDNRKLRETVSGVLNLLAINKAVQNWKYEDSREDAEMLFNSAAFLRPWAKVYKKLTEIRNDINHAGGFRKDCLSAADFSDGLKVMLTDVSKMVTMQEPDSKPTEMDNIFLNISNHPSATWGLEQIKQALKYGQIADMPFPAINENWGTDHIRKLALKMSEDIIRGYPKHNLTIHLMGELSFCFFLTSDLRKKGIRVVVSCTERIAETDEQGRKISSFIFRRFREL